MNPLIQPKRRTPVFLVALACFALSQTAQAVSPPPDGGYPNRNTAEGDSALFNLTSGTDNTAIGFEALFSNLGSFNTAIGADALSNNTTGSGNTADGYFALRRNTTGSFNTATGYLALRRNTTGDFNTATGLTALFNNTIGGENTANGVQALLSNTTGSFNTATGAAALVSNTTGDDNTATGASALNNNTTGSNNTANGVEALAVNRSGHDNTATGVEALFGNDGGDNNTANGSQSLHRNTTGSNNTANGSQALLNNTTGGRNTANGLSALFNNTTGSRNIALGNSAGFNLTTGSDNIDIGALGATDEAETIRIGRPGIQNRTFIAGIRGVTTGVANAVPVLIDSAGQLGTMSSSLRFKKEIKPMDQASEAILTLKPVTFHYKSDKTGTPQFGLIAEEVAKVNPDLVVRDEKGDLYTVRYDAVNAMLLNEFLKEHRTVQELKSAAAKQEATIARLQKQIEALTAGLQKVSAQLELSKPAQQTALNSH
jgi:hypothetical protein